MTDIVPPTVYSVCVGRQTKRVFVYVNPEEPISSVKNRACLIGRWGPPELAALAKDEGFELLDESKTVNDYDLANPHAPIPRLAIVLRPSVDEPFEEASVSDSRVMGHFPDYEKHKQMFAEQLNPKAAGKVKTPNPAKPKVVRKRAART